MRLSPLWIGAAAAGAAVVAAATALLVVGGGDDETATAPAGAPAGVVAADAAPVDGVPPPARSPRPALPGARPVASPVHCAAARDRAATLLAEFERKVTVDDRRAAADVISEAVAKGQSPPDGYNLFAGGELLGGNFTAAAWGALKAASLEWKSTYIASAGVCLSHLDKSADADALLACALELDPRSPFVLEAQAMLALRRGDCDRAKELIDLAVRLLPGDMNVLYTAGVIHFKCGDRGRALQYLHAARSRMPDEEVVNEAIKVVDPASANRPRQHDTLDHLVEECLAFLDEMEARAEVTADYYNQVNRVLWGPDYDGGDPADELRQHARDGRKRIANALEQARDQSRGPPDPFYWNQVLYECVYAYTQAVYYYQLLYAAPGRAVVLSAALGMDLLAYSSRCKGQRDLEFVFLDEDKLFEAGIRPAVDRLTACLQNNSGGAAGQDVCYRKFCDDALPVLKKYIANATANMAAAEAGFPRAAEDYANFILSYVDRGADYTARAIKAMKPTPANPGVGAEIIRNAAAISDQTLDGSIEFTVARLSESYQTLQSALEYGPHELMVAADDDPDLGKFRLCPQTRSDPVPVDPPIDPFLDALRAATTVEAGPTTFDCEVKAGAFSVGVKSTREGRTEVKVSEKVGNTSYGAVVDTGGRVGGEVSWSQSASSHGVAAKGSVKLWGEARPGGRVNYGAQVEGKLGTGITYGGNGVACYLVSGKATFNARIFAERLRG